MNGFTTFLAAIAALVTKALPSDAERLQRLKDNYPKITARAQAKAEQVKTEELIKAFNYLHKHKGTSVADYVQFIGGDQNMTDILNQQLTNKP